MTPPEKIVTRLEPRPWMDEAPTQAVMAALDAETGGARFIGGCVRDTVVSRAILDIDIATPFAPEQVIERLEAAGIKVVPTGLAHGTVTAIVPPRHFEITTLRHDVETFGRHAKVAFTADWAADAQRRDFTMNALSMRPDGAVFDAVGGLADLEARRVRFVGVPEARIREDVLRLLRFYRFQAHYGRVPADEEARDACRRLAGLLPTLSGERVAAELLKLLAAPDPLPTLAMMVEDGVLAVLLPEARTLDLLAALVPLEPSPDPVRRLAALIVADPEGCAAVAARLRLANAQRDRLAALAAPPWPIDLGGDIRVQRRALRHLGAPLYVDLVLLDAAATGRTGTLPALRASAAAWRPVTFPLKGRDVTALGLPPGPHVGRLLAAVEAWWEEGDFQADRRACLAELARHAAQ
jgi:poly(A) polymerase